MKHTPIPNVNLNTVYVTDLMQREPISVRPFDSIAEVAQLFAEKKIHSAPVVDDQGKCIGIVTSSDLVRYEAHRLSQAMESHGREFDSARYDDEKPQSQPLRFDQVGQQMTHRFQSISGGVSIADAIRLMCEKGIHHLLILDGLGKPYGVVSTLDVLAFLIGKEQGKSQ